MSTLRMTLQSLLLLALISGGIYWIRQQDWPVVETLVMSPASDDQSEEPTLVSMDWSADGETALSLLRGHANGRSLLRRHDWAGELPREPILTSGSPIWKAAISPDGSAAALFGEGGAVLRLEIDSGRSIRLLEVAATRSVHDLAFSPDGVTLAVVVESEVVLCGARGAGETLRLAGPSCEIVDADFSNDGRSIIAGDELGMIWVWDAGTSAIIQSYAAHHGSVSRVQCVPGTDRLISGGLVDGMLQVSDFRQGELLWNAFTGQGGIQALAISADGKLAATGGTSQLIIVWDLDGQSPLHTVPSQSGSVRALNFSADGRTLIAASTTGITENQIHHRRP